MSNPSSRPVNPYKRGKSKIIASLVLEERTDEQVLDFVKSNKLDGNFSVPVSMDNIRDVRAALRKAGLINSEGRIIVRGSKDIGLPGLEVIIGEESEELGEGGEQRDATKQLPGATEFVKRPDWDILTVEQINTLPDLKLKMQILEYKSTLAKVKQELKPEYATRGEIDLLRTDLSTRVGGLEEKINTLLSKFDEPEPENESDEEEETEPEEAEVEVPKKVLRLASKVNPLEVEGEAQEMEDEIIEVEGSIVARKSIGLTAKSMMLYDLARTQGFPGNLADFVNSCISDAYKGRSIELAVIDKKVIR